MPNFLRLKTSSSTGKGPNYILDFWGAVAAVGGGFGWWPVIDINLEV